MKIANKMFFFPQKQIYLIGVLVSIVIIAGVYYFYKHEEKLIREQKYEQIKAIAILKINQITQWQKERIEDANIFSQSFHFQKGFEQFLAGENSELNNDLLNLLCSLKINSGYENVFISNSDGKFSISSNPDFNSIDSATSVYIKKTVNDNKVLITDFYQSGKDKQIYIDIVAPIVNDKNFPVAAIILRVNPADYIYPLIQSLPIPSKTFETLIVRKEGNKILYLNELRHVKNTAMSFRVPLSRENIPAVQSVLGYKGFIQGPDYRGIEVLSYITSVPGTSWFMVSKVDRSEISSELQDRAIIIIAFALMLILLSVAGVVWIYNFRQKNIYRELFLTEKSLREKEEEFRITLYSIGDAVITTGINGRIKNMNLVAEKLSGWNESDAAGKKLEEVFQVINEETRLKVENPVTKIMREGLVVGLTNHSLLISKDGKEIPIADCGAPVKNSMDSITGVVLVFRNQTKERESKRELLKLSRAVEQGPASVVITNRDGDIEYVNQKFCNLTGYSKDEVKDKNPRILGSGYQDKKFYEELWNTILSGNNWSGEILNKKKDGELYWESALISPLMNNNRDITHFVAIKENITEKKNMISALIEAKEMAESANKLKDAFIANISHEIRTPLNGILGMSSLIRDTFQGKVKKEDGELFDGIDYSSKRIIRTVDMILNYSRLQVGKFPLFPKKLDLSSICVNLVKEYAAAAKNKSLGLTFLNNYGDVVVFVDEYSINMAVSNLLDNAIKYTNEGSIQVTLYKGNNDDTILDVKDTGIGISEEYVDKVFEPYLQEEMGYGRAYEGVGLGLSLIKKILILNDANISLESKKGEGTTFSINFGKVGLPFEKKTETKKIVNMPPALEKQENEVVLIVEDDQLNQLTIKRFLGDRYDTILTDSSDKALEILKKEKVDIILMDISIKGKKNGLELTRELKASNEFSHIPVIAITAHAFEEDKQNALTFGCDNFLPKPFSKQSLLDMLAVYTG